MALPPPYYNRELFSKHFLAQLLPQQPEWTAAAEAAAPVVATLRDLHRRTAPPRDPLSLITRTAQLSAES